jgi:hypothetical protein
MAVRESREIALSGQTTSKLAKRLAGGRAVRLSLVLGREKAAILTKAPKGKGTVLGKPGTAAPDTASLRRVWYVLQAKRGDSEDMEKVLQAAAESVRRDGASRALELLGPQRNAPSKVADPRATPTPPSALSTAPDHRVHEARRWAEAQAAFLAEHESVTGPELARLTGSRSVNPSARAHSWVKANRIFSVNDGTGERYPLFQLQEGHPRPQLAEILPTLRRKLSNWQIALWFASPNAWVGGWRRPIDVLVERPEIVINAARHEIGEHVL